MSVEDRFSREQKEAICHGEGPAMVLAGPGSGKTLVITQRIRYLIRELKIPPDQILVITFTRAVAAQMRESGLPKLVVNITIDQLRSDYLQIFERFYGDGGFKRLMRDGLVYEKAVNDYFPADRSSATATIVSGATPYYNGIVSDS